jgi:hypothetical protein
MPPIVGARARATRALRAAGSPHVSGRTGSQTRQRAAATGGTIRRVTRNRRRLIKQVVAATVPREGNPCRGAVCGTRLATEDSGGISTILSGAAQAHPRPQARGRLRTSQPYPDVGWSNYAAARRPADLSEPTVGNKLGAIVPRSRAVHAARRKSRTLRFC